MRYDEINLKGIYVALKVTDNDTRILSEYIQSYGLTPVNPLHMTLVKLTKGRFNLKNPPRLKLPITLKATSLYGLQKYNFKGILVGFESLHYIGEWLKNEFTDYVNGNGIAIGRQNLKEKWRPHVSLTYETNIIPEPRHRFPLHSVTFDEMVIQRNKPNFSIKQGDMNG